MTPSEQATGFQAVFNTFATAKAEESKRWPVIFARFQAAFEASRSERAAYTPYLNILDVFGLKFRELSHSRVLAWFLDEQAEHEQGSLFLRSLGKHFKLEPAELHHYTVQRERPNRVDVAVFKKGQFAIFIENKVRHDERDEQIADMLDALVLFGTRQGIPAINRYAIFLTDDGRDPTTLPDPFPEGFLRDNLWPVDRLTVFSNFATDLRQVPTKSVILAAFLENYVEAISTHPGAKQ